MVSFRRAVCRDASTTGMHPTAPNPQGGAITRLSVPLKIRSPQIEFDAEKATQLRRHVEPGILPRKAGLFGSRNHTPDSRHGAGAGSLLRVKSRFG